MLKFLRPLAATTAALGVVSVGAWAVSAEKPAEPAKPAAAEPVAVTKAEGVQVGNGKMIFAVEPKPLGGPVTKGLKWLAERQNADGGWSQGGGWRNGGANGGRVEGADVADPSDVGNTCIALLALIRAGNTPTGGEYKDAVKKGLRYVCERVEKADAKDLYVTDVRNTQIQGKIGPFADTFLATFALGELKGKGGEDETRLAKALDKTIDKIARNQKEDGTFANNSGWAPVLSQGICNKALSRAKLNGAAVQPEVFARATKQSVDALNGRAGAAAPTAVVLSARVSSEPAAAEPSKVPAADAKSAGTTVAGGLVLPSSESIPYTAVTGRASGFSGGGTGGIGDAGVKLYSFAQCASNTQDAFNGLKIDVDKAKKVLSDPKAGQDDKAKAEKTVTEYAKLEQEAVKAQTQLGQQIRNQAFVNGFGSNGGEEFLSFLNVGEALVVKAGKDWAEWDGKMQEMLTKAQDKDGSWSGHHCITGKTFCTAGALLVLMTDRTPFPEDVVKAAKAAPPMAETKKGEEKK